VTGATIIIAVGIGAIACAILVANNLRDIVGDAQVGKRTLATRLGDARTRVLYLTLVTVTALSVVAAGLLTSPWAWFGVVGLLLLVPAVRTVRNGGRGRDLIAVLKATGVAELACALAFAYGLVGSTLLSFG